MSKVGLRFFILLGGTLFVAGVVGCDKTINEVRGPTNPASLQSAAAR